LMDMSVKEVQLKKQLIAVQETIDA
jgi:hypothetical protein